jgi:hypothetical protein
VGSAGSRIPRPASKRRRRRLAHSSSRNATDTPTGIDQPATRVEARALRPAMVVDRVRDRHHACASRQGRRGGDASDPRRLRALRELKRQSASPFVFASERGGPLTPSGFASWPAPAMRPRSASRSIRTCYGMPAAMRWPTRASIPAHCRPISAIAGSIRPRAMPRCARRLYRLWHFWLVA